MELRSNPRQTDLARIRPQLSLSHDSPAREKENVLIALKVAVWRVANRGLGGGRRNLVMDGRAQETHISGGGEGSPVILEWSGRDRAGLKR